MPFGSKAIRDRARKQVAQRVRAGEPCCFCGRAIDLSLKYPHDWSFTVDHSTPTSISGGDDHSSLWRPSHALCNKRRGAGVDGSIGRNSGVLG